MDDQGPPSEATSQGVLADGVLRYTGQLHSKQELMAMSP